MKTFDPKIFVAEYTNVRWGVFKDSEVVLGFLNVGP